MNVVLISSFPAFPATAGNRSRIRQLALALRELGHALTFVLLESKYETCDEAAHVAAFGPGRFIRLRKQMWPAKWALGAAVGAGKGLLRSLGIESAYYSRLDRFRDRHFLAQLARLDLRPDVVLVEYVLDSWAFAAFPRGARRVLDTHDAFADRHKGYVARGISDYWVSLRPQAENAGFRRADVVLAIQEEEAASFRAQMAADPADADPQVTVVGHLVEVGDAAVDTGVDDAALFVASDNPANRHAIGHFLQHILPRVVRAIPGFRLRLAGSICGAVPDLPNVDKLGWVGDVREVFAQAPLSVNPMLAGTGINIKLLDAMACGVPTVSTATGVRGLPEAFCRGIAVVADGDPEGFAAAAVRFARDAKQRRDAGQLAREDAKRWKAAHLAELNRCLGA